MKMTEIVVGDGFCKADLMMEIGRGEGFRRIDPDWGIRMGILLP